MTNGTCAAGAAARRLVPSRNQTEDSHENSADVPDLRRTLDWFAATVQAGELTVTISDIRSAKGTLQVARVELRRRLEQQGQAGRRAEGRRTRKARWCCTSRICRRARTPCRSCTMKTSNEQARHQLPGNSRRRLRVQQQPQRDAQARTSTKRASKSATKPPASPSACAEVRHGTPFLHSRTAGRRRRGGRHARVAARRDAGADAARRFAAGLAREPWLAGWKTVGVESLGPTQATVEGRWPSSLAGVLYRNGPAWFDRGDCVIDTGSTATA